MIRIVLPGWDVAENPVGFAAALVVWTWLVWWTSRVVASRAQVPDTAENSRAVLGWYWLAVGLKVAIIVLWYLALGGHEITPSIGDSEGYDSDGWRLAQGLRDGRYFFSKPPFLQESYSGFPYWIGALYALFGHHLVVVSLFNALLSIWIAVMVQQIALVLFGARVAGYALLAALFYPHWISASYFVLKDVATTFVVTLAIWSVYVPRSLEVRAVAFIATLLVVAAFRPPLAVLLGCVGILQFALSETGGGRPRRTLIAAVVLMTFVVLGAGTGLTGRPVSETGFTTQAGLADDPGFLRGTRFTLNWEGFDTVVGLVSTRPVAFVRYAVDTTIRFFYGPFFLYASTGASLYPYGPLLSPFRAVLECLSGVFTGLLMPMVVIGLYECVRFRRRATALLTTWLAVGLLTLMLAGALVRWRLPFIVVVFIFAAVGCTRFRHVREFYCVYVVLYALLIGANATLQEDLILPKALLLGVALMCAMRFLIPRAANFVRARWVAPIS